jgi:hypothetical protein
MKSLDPRINRVDLQNNDGNLTAEEVWHTYEVFHQEKRGKHHGHVGSVHAPDPEMALILAKEQFARRGKCVNLWVVGTVTSAFLAELIFNSSGSILFKYPKHLSLFPK